VRATGPRWGGEGGVSLGVSNSVGTARPYREGPEGQKGRRAEKSVCL